MRAAPADQRRLLDLQAQDTALDQLAHRRRTLPELVEIATGGETVQALKDEVARIGAEVGDLDRHIRRLEADVDQVRRRAERDQQRLQSGAGAPRELESLQSEVASLARRQSELEDAELELMEQREQGQARLDSAQQALDAGAAAVDSAAGRRDVAVAEIDATAAERTAERARIAADVPGDLASLYEKIRASSGGIGAALLRARRCSGCRIELAGSDLSTIRSAAPEEVVRCEECRRILVRTEESGL